jgi:hypothetical protein
MSAPQSNPRFKLKRIALGVGVVAGVGLLGVGIWLAGWIFPIGTGVAAKTVCSDVFVAGRSPEGVLDDEMPSASFVSFEVDTASRSVTASAFGLASKTAVYRPGLGCALALEVSADSLRAQGFDPSLPADKNDAPWPEGDGKDIRPDPAGLDRGAIEAAIDQVLAANADKVEQYRAGKEALFGFFVGQTMKAMQGKANPQVINEVLKRKLA